jgi:hypothetical protein
MSSRIIQLNNKTVNIDDIIDISEFVNEELNNLLPYGYSIILKDYSAINVLDIPSKEQENNKQKEIFTSYSTIKNYLTKKITIRENIEKVIKCV